MSKTLNLVDRLLTRGRTLQKLGLLHEAGRVYQKLGSFRELPREVSDEANLQLGEIFLKRRKFKKARRHLTAAVAHEPANPQYHYLLALAVVDDQKCPSDRATPHFRKSLDLEPDQPDYLCDFGLHLVETGARNEGLAMLRRAGELALEDADLLARVAEGFRKAEEFAEARSLLRTAIFRNPRDRRFRELWETHQFAVLRCEQQRETRKFELSERSRVLKFIREEEMVDADGKAIRRDPPSSLPGPNRPRRVRNAKRLRSSES